MQIYTIGKIVAAQGIKGEVKVNPETSFPQRFQEMKNVLVGTREAYQEYLIESVRFYKNQVILALKEVTTRNEAETLIGKELYVLESELYKLPKDHFYIFQLCGLEVIDKKWGLLGTIKDVIEGPQDLYLIAPSDQSPANKSFYIPAVKAFVLDVNLEKKEMHVDLPEGLWEE